MPDSKRFLLRLNPGLFEALRRWADEDLRSINAQIEYLLTDQARRAGRLPRHTTPRPRAPEPPAELDDPEADAVPTDVGDLEGVDIRGTGASRR
jgi:hypothetical protein